MFLFLLRNKMTTTIADSIAIKIFKDKTILTGVGNELHYYFKPHSAVGFSKTILSIKLINKVHGIVLNHDEQQVLVHGEKEFVLLAKAEYNFKEIYRATLSDWITAAKYLTCDEFVLLTAHSVILRCCYVSKEAEFRLLDRSSCTDKSTLYCGSIYGDSWQTLVVLAGNAFGELLVWQPAAGTESTKTKAALLHRINAHNGVIFSIAYDANAQLLTTTSDDRSIRFWTAAVKDDNWAAATLKAMVSGYGHTARVFKAEIIKYNELTYILSVGEDSFICLWRTSGELLFKRRQQFGAVIWNLAYDVNTQIIYTVGSTGNCIAYALRDMLLSTAIETETLPPLIQESGKQYMSKIKFLEAQLLVGVTSANQFVYIDLLTENTWSIVDSFPAFKCTVLAVWGKLIALCGHKQLVVYEYQGSTEGRHSFVVLHRMVVLERIIRSFHFLSAERYLLSDEQGNCALLEFMEGSSKTYNITLPNCKERWLTTALALEQDYLLISNRQGNVMLYKQQADSFQLCDTLKHPHGYLGATLFKQVSYNSDRFVVKSCGHDGALKYLAIDRIKHSMKIMQRVSVPVTWVESVVATDIADNESELLLGFNDNHFVVWSYRTDFVQQIPCGGGHRCWHYFIAFNAEKEPIMHVAFIRNKQVIHHSLKLRQSIPHDLTLPAPNSWHVKACNIVKVINSREATYLVSAGEDNLIKVSAFNSSSMQLRQMAELHMHISNIRALAVQQRSPTEYLIFTAGGRAQLCISKLQLSSCIVEELYNFMLFENSENQQKHYKLDPETRIMAVDTVEQETGYLIYLGCSDGNVFCMHWQGSNLTLRHELYYGKCILQLRVVANKYVVIGATDGILHIYDLTLREFRMQLTHHASGINALACELVLVDSNLHILTGGDDQSVAYSCLCLQTLALLKSWHLPFLHTAQVTAACLAYDENNVLSGYTSGVDQMVYKLHLENGQVLQQCNVPIADAKGLCIDANSYCFLYGCGIQIFRCQS